MKKAIILISLMAMAFATMAQNSKKVLFIGNSYTDVNNLPQLVKDASESAGERLTFGSNTPGGCTFAQHCLNQSMDLIRQGGWDVVVLQEQSQYPSFPQGQVEQEVFPFATQLVDAVYANNPEGEAMFYMTWGRKNGDERNAIYFPVLGTYEGMDSMLYERYMYMARTNDASVCPVGRVWRYLRNNNPEIELYQSDDSHPTMAGSYAAACSFFTMIYHRTPTDIVFRADLNETDATTIREAVKNVVYNNLSFWLRQNGASDTTQTDTTQTDTTQVDTTVVNIPTMRQLTCSVYPNPAQGQVVISLSDNNAQGQAVLFDPRGQAVRQFAINGNNHTLSLTGLAAGIYTLTITTAEGRGIGRIVVQ